jgi:hypothetical protein
MALYTIESWLRGKVDYDISDSAIKAILYDNKVSQGTPVEETTEKERELCLADLLMWLSSASSVTSGEKISDGGWSHQKSAKQIADRAGLIKRAQSLYAKWNSDKAKTAVGTTITVKPIY